MSRLADVVPPSDLLDQVEGIEQGLRQRRRLGAAGIAALLLSVVQIAVSLGLTGTPDFSSLADSWPFWLGGILLVGGVLLIGRARFWIRESKRPFRYTFSVGDLEALTPIDDELFLVWLKEDLVDKLAQRIQRLSRLDEAHTETSDGVHHDTHIHVTASVGARIDTDEDWVMEILPWIRVGPPDSPATRAHRVQFRFEDHRGDSPPELNRDDYEKLFERMFFNIATELYQRIREDVERKIALLPGRYLRAVAYFHEARDYADSNTLDAYEAAEQLYDRVLELYVPGRGAPARSKWHRAWRVVAKTLDRGRVFVRSKLSGIVPRAGRTELLIAQAYVGYANTLLYRRTLAGLSGARLNPVFETRWDTGEAVNRLEAISADVPGHRDALFDAYVTRALALSQLQSPDGANEMLNKARELDPRRAEIDAPYLMVAGDLEERVLQGIELFRRAVDARPGFEVAQFSLAVETETLWRSRPELEATVADMVFAEYERVIQLNPGNLSAWANRGYMRWLLEDGKRAAQDFRRARDYKEVKRDTFVSELDYGLARIAAEQGEFAEAYKRYIDAVAAQLAQGVSFNSLYTTYYFSSLTEALIERFDRYEEEVAKHWGKPGASVAGPTTSRVRDSVYAFVLNDCAEAHYNFYLRTGDRRHLDVARAKLEFAANELHSRYAMVYLNLYRVGLEINAADDECDQHVKRVMELAPAWIDGKFQVAQHHILRMNAAKASADQHRAAAEEARKEARRRKEDAAARRRSSIKARAQARRERELVGAAPRELRSGAEAPTPREGHWAATGESDHYDPHEGPRVSLAASEIARRAEDRASALEDTAARLVGEAEGYERIEAELTQEADRSEAEARRRAREAKRTLRPMLVHRNYWRGRGEPRFNWEAFTWPELLLDHSWERELSDLDVRALSAWCVTCLALQGARQDEEDDPDRFTPDQVQRLAEYIRTRFYESNFEILRMLEEQEPRDSDLSRIVRKQQLAGSIESWLRREATFWAYTWLTEDYFDSDQIVERLRELTTRPDLPSYLEVLLLTALGDMEVAHGNWANGRRAYEAAAASDANRGARVNSEPFYCRATGFALWGMEEYSAAVQAFRQGVEDLPAGRPETIVERAVANGAAGSADGFFALRDWLEEERAAAHHAGDQDREAEFEAALSAMARSTYLTGVRRPRTPIDQIAAVDKPAYVEQVVLEVDQAASEGSDPGLVDRLRNDGVQEIHDSVLAATGFPPPPAWISIASNLHPDRYSIRICGIPVDRGPAPDGPSDLYSAVVSHTTEVVVRHLDAFADTSAVDDFVRAWCSQEDEEDRERLREEALPDDESLLRFVEVVRALLRDRVPVHDLGPILAVFALENARTPELHDLVEEVRRPLAGGIADVVSTRRPVEFPAELLDAVRASVHGENGERFLAMPIRDAYETRQAVLHWLAPADPRECVAVVEDPGLRPFARELVAGCCPDLLVVTADELAGRSRPAAGATR